MNVLSIYQNAEVVSESKSGEINRVIISEDEYKFLREVAGQPIEVFFGDSWIELDYHSEFIPLIRQAEGAQ